MRLCSSYQTKRRIDRITENQVTSSLGGRCGEVLGEVDKGAVGDVLVVFVGGDGDGAV